MNKEWPMVSLKEILTPVSRPENVIPEKTYHILGAHWYAQGLYTKDVRNGSQVQAKQLYRVERGDFVYNRLFAWKGSFAVATNENHGCYVSNEFPCFIVNNEIAESTYLWKYFSRASIWDEALSLSSGGTPTSRNRLKEEKLLFMKIPLPPLSEQKWIVAKIEELAKKIEEAIGLRYQAVNEDDALLVSAMYKYFDFLQKEGYIKRSIVTFATILRGRGPIYQEGSGKLAINQKCVRLDGVNITYAKEVSEEWIQGLPSHYILQEDDILVNSTGEGTIGRSCIVTCNGKDFPFDSHVLVIRTEKDKAIPKFINYFLRSPIGQAEIESSKGAKTTKQTELGTTKLGNIAIPIPQLSEQRRIVAYLDNLQSKVDELKRLQSETRKELNAMLPSILDKAFKGEL
jgi:type I restriction enzyme S subunit